MPAGSRFRVRCWGARGTSPSPGPRTLRYGGNTSCVEIRTADQSLIVLDAGSGARSLGAALLREPDNAAATVFLTHQHLDHVQGLPQFASQLAKHRTITLRCGNTDAHGLSQLANALLSPPLYPVVDGVMEALVLEDFLDTVPTPVGDSCLVYRSEARHPGGAAIIRLNDARGTAIAFAPDNELSYASTDEQVIAWRAELAHWLHGVPILIHDAMYADSELSEHTGWGHSSAEEAARFALDCKAEMLVLFHHHPDRHDETIDAMVENCRAIAAAAESPLRVLAAWEGLSLSL